jgi:hypothetical protein
VRGCAANRDKICRRGEARGLLRSRRGVNRSRRVGHQKSRGRASSPLGQTSMAQLRTLIFSLLRTRTQNFFFFSFPPSSPLNTPRPG